MSTAFDDTSAVLLCAALTFAVVSLHRTWSFHRLLAPCFPPRRAAGPSLMCYWDTPEGDEPFLEEVVD